MIAVASFATLVGPSARYSPNRLLPIDPSMWPSSPFPELVALRPEAMKDQGRLISVSLSKRDWFQNDTSYHPASSSNSSYRLCLEEQRRRYLRSQFISFKLSKRFEFPRQHAAPCHHRVRWMPSSSARASLASPAACCESLPSDTLREAALRTPTQIYDKLGYSRLYFTFFYEDVLRLLRLDLRRWLLPDQVPASCSVLPAAPPPLSSLASRYHLPWIQLALRQSQPPGHPKSSLLVPLLPAPPQCPRNIPSLPPDDVDFSVVVHRVILGQVTLVTQRALRSRVPHPRSSGIKSKF